jgi:hypothetical protein
VKINGARPFLPKFENQIVTRIFYRWNNSEIKLILLIYLFYYSIVNFIVVIDRHSRDFPSTQESTSLLEARKSKQPATNYHLTSSRYFLSGTHKRRTRSSVDTVGTRPPCEFLQASEDRFVIVLSYFTSTASEGAAMIGNWLSQRRLQLVPPT